jgi:hypothetical protein
VSTTYSPGRYRVVVIDQGFDEAATGTPFFFLQVRILSRLNPAGTPENCPRLERTIRQYLGSEVGLQILGKDLRQLGVEVDDITRLNLESADPISLVGREIEVECADDEYQRRTVERWRIARRRLSPDQVRALGARFGAGRTGTNPPAPPPNPPAENTPF